MYLFVYYLSVCIHVSQYTFLFACLVCKSMQLSGRLYTLSVRMYTFRSLYLSSYTNVCLLHNEYVYNNAYQLTRISGKR